MRSRRLSHGMSLVVLAAMISAGVAACGGDKKKDEAPAEAAEAPAEPSTPAEPAAPPGPAPAEGYDWTLNEMIDDPGRLALSYALPESDDMPLGFICDEGSGRVTAEVDSGLTGVGAIIIRSGDSQAMYPVTGRVHSEMSGGEFLSIDIDVADATLRAFKSAGWLNLTVAGTARDMAAHPGVAQGAITSFFDRCAAAPADAAATGGASASAAPVEASPG